MDNSMKLELLEKLRDLNQNIKRLQEELTETQHMFNFTLEKLLED